MNYKFLRLSEVQSAINLSELSSRNFVKKWPLHGTTIFTWSEQLDQLFTMMAVCSYELYWHGFFE